MTFVAKYEVLGLIPINPIEFLWSAGMIMRVSNDFKRLNLE